MKNLIVELRVNGKLDVTEDKDTRDLRTVRSLLDKIHLNVAELISYREESDTKPNEDNDNPRTLFEDETTVYIRLSVEPESETFYSDGGYNLLKYIADAIDFRPSRISQYHEREDNNFTETIIEITVGEVVDGVSHYR